MVDIKKILASASPEAIQKLREIMNSKDDEALKSYLDTLIKDANKVESAVKVSEPVKTKVEAYFNPTDYDWMRYKGKKAKRVFCNGMILKVEPEDVFGIAKVVDLYGNYKCILPAYKTQMIALEPDITNLIKAKCRPFSGDVSLVMKACKERIPEKVIEQKKVVQSAVEKVCTFKMKLPEMEFIITKPNDNRFDVNPNFDIYKFNKELEKKFASEIQKQLKKRPEYDNLEEHYKRDDILGSTTGINIPYDFSLYMKRN